MLAVPLLPSDPAETILAEMRQALASGERTRIEALFAEPSGASYLLAAAKRGAPLPQWRAAVFPAPPGWKGGGYWATFHTRQPIEQDHDPIYRLVPRSEGLRLGSEVREMEEGANRIRTARTDVHLLPTRNRAEVAVDLDLSGAGPRRAGLLRLQDVYELSTAAVDGDAHRVVTGDDAHIPRPEKGDVLRVGGLIVP